MPLDIKSPLHSRGTISFLMHEVLLDVLLDGDKKIKKILNNFARSRITRVHFACWILHICSDFPQRVRLFANEKAKLLLSRRGALRGYCLTTSNLPHVFFFHDAENKVVDGGFKLKRRRRKKKRKEGAAAL